MARIRYIKPGFWANDTLAECSRDARLLWIGMWTHADRNGVIKSKPNRLRAEVFRFDDLTADQVEVWLRELESRGFIRRYVADGEEYAQIANFAKHQKVHRDEAAFHPTSGTLLAPYLHPTGTFIVQAPVSNSAPQRQPPEKQEGAPGQHPTSTLPAPDKQDMGSGKWEVGSGIGKGIPPTPKDQTPAPPPSGTPSPPADPFGTGLPHTRQRPTPVAQVLSAWARIFKRVTGEDHTEDAGTSGDLERLLQQHEPGKLILRMTNYEAHHKAGTFACETFTLRQLIRDFDKFAAPPRPKAPPGKTQTRDDMAREVMDHVYRTLTEDQESQPHEPAEDPNG